MEALEGSAIAILEIFTTVSITILTILIPVYVIAFSLVGPSAQRRKEELDRIKAEETQANADAIENAKKALDNQDAVGAGKKLQELEEQRIKIEEDRRNTENKYSSLGLNRALIHPSLYLICAAIAFKFATSFTALPHFAIFLVVGVICFVKALYLILDTLKLIEELGKNVSGFNREELATVLTEVLRERDKTKEKPPTAEITLNWHEKLPPFHVKKVSQST